MFKFLERYLGKSLSWYEMLMRSKEEKNTITNKQIQEAANVIKPLATVARQIINLSESDKQPPKTLLKSWPENKKKQPLPFYGTIDTKTHTINIFVNEEKLEKDESNFFVEAISQEDFFKARVLQNDDNALLQNKQCTFKETISLPIWEEVIHRDLAIHKKIVSIAPQKPWTLYKLAKSTWNDAASETGIVNGFPQWVINNQDFRKIKDLTFLFQISFTKSKIVFYVFAQSAGVHVVKQQ